MPLRITLAQLYTGHFLRMNIQRKVVCNIVKGKEVNEMKIFRPVHDSSSWDLVVASYNDGGDESSWGTLLD